MPEVVLVVHVLDLQVMLMELAVEEVVDVLLPLLEGGRRRHCQEQQQQEQQQEQEEADVVVHHLVLQSDLWSRRSHLLQDFPPRLPGLCWKELSQRLQPVMLELLLLVIVLVVVLVLEEVVLPPPRCLSFALKHHHDCV